MDKKSDLREHREKLELELRRGILVLATLSRLDKARYGYALIQDLGEHGLEIDQGTLYPLLRRLESQGLLLSEWDVDGPRPRRYYRLSSAGAQILATLSDEWFNLASIMDGLLTNDTKEI